MRIHLATVLLLSGAPLFAQLSKEFEARLAKAEAEIKKVMAARQVPGLAFAVGDREQLLAVRSYGWADLEHRVAVRPDTCFRTASIAKPMTAVLCMQAVERGEFDLDKPVRSYLSEFPEKRWPILPRQLLSHLGGVRHYKPGETQNARRYRNTRRGLAIFAADPLLHEPGTRYRYTTFGYNLLGAAVCAATGMDMGELLQKRIFTPAGMKHSYIDDQRAIIPHRARGYAMGRGGKVINCRFEDTSYKIPGGGLRCSAEDLVRFAQGLMNHKLAKPGSVAQMWTRARRSDGKAITYGLGFGVQRQRKPRVVSHSGGQAGTNTMLVIRPDDGLAVALMCNMEGAGMNRLGPRIAAILCGE